MEDRVTTAHGLDRASTIARRKGVERQVITRLVHKGRIPGWLVGGVLYVRESDVDAVLIRRVIPEAGDK